MIWKIYARTKFSPLDLKTSKSRMASFTNGELINLNPTRTKKKHNYEEEKNSVKRFICRYFSLYILIMALNNSDIRNE